MMQPLHHIIKFPTGRFIPRPCADIFLHHGVEYNPLRCNFQPAAIIQPSDHFKVWQGGQFTQQRDFDTRLIENGQDFQQMLFGVRELIDLNQTIKDNMQRSQKCILIMNIINPLSWEALETSFFHHLSSFMQGKITPGNLPRQQFHGQRMPINRICDDDKILHIIFFSYFHMRISLKKQRQWLWRQFSNAQSREKPVSQYGPGNKQNIPPDALQNPQILQMLFADIIYDHKDMLT